MVFEKYLRLKQRNNYNFSGEFAGGDYVTLTLPIYLFYL